MQKTLHIRLKQRDKETAELRYFFENPNDFRERELKMADIQTLIDEAETHYYICQPLMDAIKIGKQLYQWLDGENHFMTEPIASCKRVPVLVLAIDTQGNLAHLPWEVLHDGTLFLVQRKNPMIAPVRWQGDMNPGEEPENRALRVLFMACSPMGVGNLLDFEQEEGMILKSTAKQPLSLTVEESGNLDELKYLTDAYGPGYFDVFHLSGHANITDEGPRFYTESDIGEPAPASAEEIADALPHLPKLIFLSGCRTGEAGKAGGIPSMAEELLDMGAGAVLGWGRPVSDYEASAAAAELYGALSTGHELARAVAMTWQALIKNKARDWHLLRLYSAGDMPGGLVTSPRTKGRLSAPPLSVATHLFGRDKVPTRESFIGRRRELQRSLKTLRDDNEKIGVLIHGMGGLGKSSLASRLCDRLKDSHGYGAVIWVGMLDEFKLVNQLTENLKQENLRGILKDPNIELKYKLWNVFEEMEEPLLFVLDDFEANFETDAEFKPKLSNGKPILGADAKFVLEALRFGIEKANSKNRVIITSRYLFDGYETDYFAEQLGRFPKADVKKKLNRLEQEKKITEKGGGNAVALMPKAEAVADGNPRLLEWLCDILGEKGLDHEKILARMAEKELEFRESILAEELLNQQDLDLRKMLARISVYEIGVPREAVEAIMEIPPSPPLENGGVAESPPLVKEDLGGFLDKHLNRASALGLIEITRVNAEGKLYRVPHILTPLLTPYMPEDMQGLCGVAARVLYQIWWNEEKATEERGLEIHRLALAGDEKEIAITIAKILATQWYNRSRFRELEILCQKTLNIVGEDYRLLHSLARAEEVLGKVSQALAHYEQALQDCPDADKKEKAAILNNVAGIYAMQGQNEKALKAYQQSSEICESIGNLQGKADTLHEIGRIYANQGEPEKAMGFFQQSADIEESIGNLQGKAATLHQIGIIYANQGEPEKAMGFFQQSLEIKESIGDLQGKAATLHCIGMIYANQGEPEKAMGFFQQSSEICESIGNLQGKAMTLQWIGKMAYDKGNYKTALVHWRESAAILEYVKSPEAENIKKWIAKAEAKMSEQG